MAIWFALAVDIDDIGRRALLTNVLIATAKIAIRNVFAYAFIFVYSMIRVAVVADIRLDALLAPGENAAHRANAIVCVKNIPGVAGIAYLILTA